MTLCLHMVHYIHVKSLQWVWSIVLTYGPLLIYSDGIYIYDFSNEDPLVNLGIELRVVLTFGGFDTFAFRFVQ